MAHAAAAHTEHGHDDHAHDHHEPGFWRKWVFSTDHKMIGIQYIVTGLAFLFFGFGLMMVMRWSIAHGADVLPGFWGKLLHGIFGDAVFDKALDPNTKALVGYSLSTQGYNVFGAMHGTIMVFFGIVPIAFAGFGNFVMPLQIGAIDMAFPRLNMASFWSFFISCVIMVWSFFVEGSAAKSGWTNYPPLAGVADQSHHVLLNGGTLWLLGMVFNITSSLLGAVNFITTFIQLRAPGMTWGRLPFFCWAQFITAYLLLLAFPPLESAAIMNLFDRVFGSSFFMPTGLVVNAVGPDGQQLLYSGGGSPVLWQHLFWFLAHPEVYVLILPGIGMVTEIIACNSRKPIWGYKAMVGAIFVLAFLSFIVWAHHMYMTGMGPKVSAFFQTTTILISVPSVILLTALLLSLWGGSLRFNTPMLFATAFLPMFGIGGLTGVPLAFNAVDLYMHDTYYVIAHFHYVVAPGTIFAIFAGVYHWYPKASGRMLSETLGKLHFWGSLIAINALFMPMFMQGMAGVHRRWWDGGKNAYEATVGPWLDWNLKISYAAWALGAVQLIFVFNFCWSMFYGKKVPNDNPWEATTLEWDTPTPPPHGNFTKPITVYRGPYEYSVPGDEKDFTPQSEPPKDSKAPDDKPHA
ncbi:MAG: cbb3-type cytochrome c oxidase subunit I [Verrucomicrobiota bacterium]